MTKTKEIQQKILDKTPRDYHRVVKQAFSFVDEHYGNQKRQSGEPVSNHLYRTALACADYGLDTAYIIAALLHHTRENQELMHSARKLFGSAVYQILINLQEIDTIEKNPDNASSLINYYLQHTLDIRYIFIQLFNIHDNMQTVDALSADMQKFVSKNAFNIYAPLAELLDLNNVKADIESAAFKILYPTEYEAITQLLEKANVSDRQREIVEKELRKVIDTLGFPYKLFGRTKSKYSIFNKMFKYQDEGLRTSISAIRDIYAYTVLTETVEDAYNAIFALMEWGTVHPEHCDDYLSNPKPNGYSAYHLSITPPSITKLPIEIQVLTDDMYHTNTYGTASHIAYKMSKQRIAQATDEYVWVSDLHEAIANHKKLRELQFSAPINIDLGSDTIFVLTPKGRIVELPKGATVIDFAYRVHTKIGDRATLAIVDGKKAKLNQTLRSNQVVEIVTSAQDKFPNPQWLNFAVTKSARDKIQRGLKKRIEQSR